MSFDFIDRKFAQKPKCEPVVPDTMKLWWCDNCQNHYDNNEVIGEERCARYGGDVDEYCADCENGGWIMSSYQASGAPNLEECGKCYNPRGYRSP